jgi:CBS domain containing-hemolysin-like protein
MDADLVRPLLLFTAFILLLANAFFVAAEFALIALRRPRVEQAAREGDRRSAGVLPLLERAEELALTAQIGSSAASVGLGMVLAVWLHGVTLTLGGAGPGIGLAGMLVLAGVLAALVHASLGVQIPKILGIQRAEWVAVRLAVRPLVLLTTLLRPVHWLISHLVAAIARLFRLQAAGFHPLVHTQEEIRLLVAQGHAQGVVEEDEREMIHGVFGFSDTVAREVMTPRTDVIAVEVTAGLDEVIERISSEGHSRLPVYEESVDNIVGVLLAKDLLPVTRAVDRGEREFDLRAVMREPYFVPDTKPVDDLLAEFKEQGVHFAIVVDEFGGTYGVVTMEDLLEEIVGEISDEYDVEEPLEPEFEDTPEGDVLIDGGVSISEVNQRCRLELPEEDFDTIGGYIFGSLGRVPVAGDRVTAPGEQGEVELVVEEAEERRVALVRLTRLAGAARAAAEAEASSEGGA